MNWFQKVVRIILMIWDQKDKNLIRAVMDRRFMKEYKGTSNKIAHVLKKNFNFNKN